MKNKKILLGLALGSFMATTPLFTGCKSDIVFNQSDLDNALKNVNQYLETQNNYSSEFAKNVLNDYLLKGIVRNQYNSQFAYTVSNKESNAFNDSSSNFVSEYKIYRQGNKIKELCNIAGSSYDGQPLQANTNNYREITSEYKTLTTQEPGPISNISKTFYYSGTTYSEELSKTTDQYSKTTFTDKTIDELDNWTIFGDLSNIYSNLMLAIVNPETSTFGMGDYLSTKQTDVVMGQEGEYETFQFTNVFFDETVGEDIVILSFNIKFKDGILQSVMFTNEWKEDYSEAMKMSQIITIEITENIQDFNIDKTNY